MAKADDSLFAVVLPCVFNFHGDVFENAQGVSEVETAFGQCLRSRRRVESYAQTVIVYTTTYGIKVDSAGI